MKKRIIKHIVIHCTATQQNVSVASIQNYWKHHLGWQVSGYHYIITPLGQLIQLEDELNITNGVRGHNKNSIHVAYIGGVDQFNMPIDNRTEAQKIKMLEILSKLKIRYPRAEILGHRDFLNVAKACPSFDVKQWLIKYNL